MRNHFDENLSALPKVQEFPTGIEHFDEITTNYMYLNTLAQLAKRCFLHKNVLIIITLKKESHFRIM